MTNAGDLALEKTIPARQSVLIFAAVTLFERRLLEKTILKAERDAAPADGFVFHPREAWASRPPALTPAVFDGWTWRV